MPKHLANTCQNDSRASKATTIKKTKKISTESIVDPGKGLPMDEHHGFRPALLAEPFVQYLLQKLDEADQHRSVLTLRVEELEAELRKLKKLPKKPIIKPSKLDEDPTKNKLEKESRRTGKRKKKETLQIHETKKIKIVGLTKEWKLIGYEKHIRQDFVVRPHNIEYALEKWKGPNGEIKIAKLPPHLQNTHFGSVLKSFIIHQYYECGVTQPLIYSSLLDYGVDISSGQVNAILNENNEVFHAEKETLLAKGIELKEELRTDDTGARHQFRNAFCNCINSSVFTYFETTYSKSRINFLEILRQSRSDYIINEQSLSYIQKEKFASKYYHILKRSYERGERIFENKKALESFFVREGIKAKYAIKQITEALLIANYS